MYIYIYMYCKAFSNRELILLSKQLYIKPECCWKRGTEMTFDFNKYHMIKWIVSKTVTWIELSLTPPHNILLLYVGQSPTPGQPFMFIVYIV